MYTAVESSRQREVTCPHGPQPGRWLGQSRRQDREELRAERRGGVWRLARPSDH